MALNQRVSAPYGDITIFNTPKTDRFIAQHQLEERQAELQRQKEIDEADKQLTSHLGNVLNPDIPDIVNGWQEYKNAKKQLLFDTKLQSNPAAYAQKQVEVNTKLARAMQVIGDSSQRKQALNDQLKLARTAPQKMEDNAAQRIMMGMNTPSSFAMQNPDFDNHTWQGPDEDFTKAFNDAKGKERVLKTNKTPMGKNGEQLAIENISGFNDPSVYMASLNAKNNDRKHAMNAAKVFANMSDEEKQRINEHYAALPKERFSNWGMKEKPDLDPADPNDPVQALHSIQAKAYALTSQFTSKEGKPEINTEIRRKLNDASKLNLQSSGIRQRLAASKELAAYKKSIGVGVGSGNGGDGYADSLEPIMQKWEDNAKKKGAAPYVTADGQSIPAYTIDAPVELRKALEVKDGVKSYQPDEVKVTQDGRYFGVFYKKEPSILPDGKKNTKAGVPIEVNGKYAVDPTIPTVVLDRDDAKLSYAKQFLGKKDMKQLIEGIGSKQSPKPKKESKSEDVNIDDAKNKYGISY